MDSKVKRIDEHLYNPARTEKQYLVTNAKRLHAKTSLRYRLAKLNQPGGMFNLSGNTFNPHAKSWGLLFLIIAVIVGGGILAQGPLLHASVLQCIPHTTVNAPGAGCSDPTTLIQQWGDLPQFNTNNGVGGSTVTTGLACAGGGTANCMKMQSTGTNTSISISTSQFDVTPASGKTLALHISWNTNAGAEASAITWGYYLTTNGTIPKHDIGSSSAYNPRDDGSVVFLDEIDCVNNCGGFVNQVIKSISYVLPQSGSGNSINSADTGSTNGGSQIITNQVTIPSVVTTVDSVNYLNYTGTTPGLPCDASSGVVVGAGCSWQGNAPITTVSNTYYQSSVRLPTFNYPSGLFLGVFARSGLGVPIQFTYQGASNGNLDVFIYTAGVTQPYIDTGGFFGPVIKALISLGVFILQNLLQFASYLWGILQPIFTTIINLLISILASIAAIVITVIKAVLNAIGTGLGISALGDNLFTFLGDIASFFTTFFGNAVAQLSSFLTFLTNGYSTISASFGTYWTDIANWTSGIKDFLAGLWVIGAQLFTISFAFMFSGWLLFGAKKFSDSVGEGMEWFNLTRQFLMIGVAIALFLFTMILHYVIIPSFHAIQATGEAKKTAEPDVVIGGTGVG